jgi:hypothetical protein
MPHLGSAASFEASGPDMSTNKQETAACGPVSNERKTLNIGETPSNVLDLETYSPEQRRLTCAWAGHEHRSQVDPLCAPYDWFPGWTGKLTGEEIIGVVMLWTA